MICLMPRSSSGRFYGRGIFKWLGIRDSLFRLLKLVVTHWLRLLSIKVLGFDSFLITLIDDVDRFWTDFSCCGRKLTSYSTEMVHLVGY